MDQPRQREAAIAQAAQLLGRADRAAFLHQACAGDAQLRQRIESLLEGTATSPRETTSTDAKAATSPPDSFTGKPGERVGRYKLLQQIGQGGCGVVYMAEQEYPVRRRVALKVIKLGMDTKEVVARFEAERQALALMDHPHIAKVLDAGATEAGRPFFVMELVQGVKITDYCDQQKLATRERLQLFAQVCHAIQHAHQKGIIHRDIKPSNILVTVTDGAPTPKVIDFGIAKATQGRLTDQTLFTALEQFIGTPAYMSPEQAEMTGLDIDTRSDIYSLGVLLYELLTGSTPFDLRGLLAAGLDEIRRRIREEEPVRPSTRLSTLTQGDLTTVASRRQTDPPRLIHTIRGDLDWIVMKALEKDRTRRYATANGLAMDIQRFLQDETVTAAAPSTGYKLRRFVRRHRRTVIAACLFVLALLGGIAGTTWGLVRALHAKRESERQASIAKHTLDFLTGMFNQVDPAVAQHREITVREVLDNAGKSLEAAFPNQPLIELPIRQSVYDMYEKLGRYDLARPQAEAALRLAKAAHPTGDHSDVAASMNNLGLVYQGLGRFSDALPIFEAAVHMSQRLHKGDDLDVAGCLNSYALCLDYLGRWAEALPRFQDALAMLERLYKGDHPTTAETLQNLAGCMSRMGRNTEALSKFEASLQMRQRYYKTDHPDVARGLNNLAGCLRDLGRPLEALPRFHEALAMRQRIYNGDHPSVAISLDNVASCLSDLGRFDEALVQQQAGLEMWRRICQGDHPDLAISLYATGQLLSSLGRFSEALTNYEAALAMRQRVYHGDHHQVAQSLGGVARALERLDRDAEALTRLEAALQMYQRLYPGDNQNVAAALNNVAICLERLGRPAEALPNHEAALAMRRRILQAVPAGTEDLYKLSEVAQSLDNLASCLGDLGLSTQAVHNFDEALGIRQRLSQAQPGNAAAKMELARIQRELGDLHSQEGATALAAQAYSNALQLAESILATAPGNSRASKLRLNIRLRLGMVHAEVAVREISPGGMAQQIGLQPGDVILRFAGRRVSCTDQLPLLIRTAKGSPLELEVRREGKSRSFQVPHGKLGVTTEDRLLQDHP